MRVRYPVVFFTARGLPGENRDTTDTVTAALRMLRLPGEACRNEASGGHAPTSRR